MHISVCKTPLHTMSRQNGKPAYHSKMLHSGSLEVIEVGTQEDTERPSSRPSSSKKAPPIPGSRHSLSTVNGKALPTVEKSLVSVKRKEPQSQLRVDMGSLQLSDDEGDDIVAMANLDGGSALLAGNTSKSKSYAPSKVLVSAGGKHPQAAEESDESSDEESAQKAPNELIMEFLQCVMSKDLENGLKLCKMILLYEPDNSRALKFLPLLQQKMEQDEAKKSGEGETDDSDNTDSDDEDEDSDESSDDESDDESSSDSSSDEDDSKDKNSVNAGMLSQQDGDANPEKR